MTTPWRHDGLLGVSEGIAVQKKYTPPTESWWIVTDRDEFQAALARQMPRLLLAPKYANYRGYSAEDSEA